MSPDTGLLPSGGYPESAKLGPNAQRPGPLLPQFPQWLLQTLPRPLEPLLHCLLPPSAVRIDTPLQTQKDLELPFPSTLSSHCSPGQLPGVTPRVSACQALWWDIKC